MDFKKLETIFLMAFLGLNIFLFSIFIQNKKVNSQLNNGEERDPIEVRLSKDRITYEDTLSQKKEKGYFLSAEETIFNPMGESIGNFPNPTMKNNHQEISTVKDYTIAEKAVENEVSRLLSDEKFFIYPNEYQYQPLLSSLTKENPKLVASQIYENLPFNDDSSRLEIHLKPIQQGLFQIESLNYAHLTNIVNLREKQDLISQREAISTLYYNSKISQDAKINWCYLAYGKILKVREKNVYVPIWFVSITPKEEKSRVEQINAVNNTIITNNTIPTVEK